MAVKDVPEERLDEKQRRRLTRNPYVGTPFDAMERLFPAYDNGKVFDTGIDLQENGGTRDLRRMLRRDGQARALEQVLTLPLRAAELEIRAADGGQREVDLVNDVLVAGDKLNTAVDQATAAVVYRHAFFEKEWEIDGGTVRYKQLHWRPPTSCEVGWDPISGTQQGFRQRTSGLDSLIVPMRVAAANGSTPGYIDIPKSRAWIYTHGIHREPIRGISDLDVAYWAFETRQKVLFLLFQFLEGQSLPKILVYGDSLPAAEENADAIAAGKASAVVAMERLSDPTLKTFEIVESSGAGAGQFLEAIKYLEGQMTKSVLASFIDLGTPGGPSLGLSGGTLSADQSQFFLSSRQAVANELANSVQENVFKPLCVYNYGADAKVPKLSIGPLSRAHTERALALLTTIMSAETVNAPSEFLGALLKTTATHLGLDEEEVRRTVDDYVTKRNSEPTKRELEAEALRMKGTVDASAKMVARTKAGQDPKDAAKALRRGRR